VAFLEEWRGVNKCCYFTTHVWMTMKTIAIMLMIPLTARKAGFWMLICGRDRVPATTARAPIMKVVVAVKFLSSRRFLIL